MQDRLRPSTSVRLGLGALADQWPILALFALLFSAAPTAAFALFWPFEPDRGAVALRYAVQGLFGIGLSIAATQVVVAWKDGRTLSPVALLSAIGRRFLGVWAVSVVGGAAIALGAVLFIVPGVLLALAWAVIIPIRALEPGRVVDAFRRSAALTRGSRWSLLFIALINGAVFVGIYLTLYALAVGIDGLAAALAIPSPGWMAQTVLVPVGTAAMALWMGVVNAANYLELTRIEAGEEALRRRESSEPDLVLATAG